MEDTVNKEEKTGFKRLSKQQKKKLKYEASKSKKRLMKKKAVQKKKQARAELLCSMTEDERKSFLAKEKEEAAFREQERIRAYNEGILVLLDLSYYPTLTEIEQNSLVKQITESVGYLRKCSKIHLKLVCINTCEELQKRLENEGSRKWLVEVCSHDCEYFSKTESSVMLSPDAEEALEDICKDQAYIIGGLVDRTKRKGESLSKASSKGLPAKRLPIEEQEIMVSVKQSTKPVLNINTVIEILQNKADGKTWKETFLSSIPRRLLF